MAAKGKHYTWERNTELGRNIVPYSKWQNSLSLNVKIVVSFEEQFEIQSGTLLIA